MASRCLRTSRLSLTVRCAPTLRRRSWFLQNPHLAPGCVVLVATADADWNPRRLAERFETGSGQPLPFSGSLGDCFVLARVWPSAVLKRKDLYLRGRVREMLGELDVSGNIVLLCPELGKEAHGPCEFGELGDDDGYATEVDVRIVILKADEGDVEGEGDEGGVAEAAATPGKRPSTLGSSGTPSGSGTFAAMSPSYEEEHGPDAVSYVIEQLESGTSGRQVV